MAGTVPFDATAHPYRWAMLTGVSLLYFCFGLTASAMAPLVRPIAAEFALSHGAMGAVLGAWPLVYIVSAVPCGAALDRFGLRWSLALGGTIMGVSSLLRALATDQLTLYLAVAVFGLGGPLISIGAPKLIALWFAGADRAIAIGFYWSATALGSISALALTNSVMMPLVADRWRTVLVVYAVVALAAVAAWLAVSAHAVSARVDRSQAAEPSRSQLAVFAGLLRARPVQLVLLMSVGIFFFNHGLNNWLPEILRTGGMDVRRAGYWASVPTAVGIAGALVVPRLASPVRRPAVLAVTFACAGAATLLIHAAAGPLLALGLVFQGIARGSMTAVAMLLLMDHPDVDNRDMGAAGGLFFSAAEIGGVLGPLAIGALYDWTGGFTSALHVLTGVCAGLLVLLSIFRRAEHRGASGKALRRSSYIKMHG